MATQENKVRRIGIIGFGAIGQYLVEAIKESKDLELGFVWNRTCNILVGKIEQNLILKDLSKFNERNVDLIVEVAHPCITEKFGERFLDHADYMIGSPTTLASDEIRKKIFAKARSNLQGHGLYVPSGAFWGVEDVRKMANKGILEALSITMKMAPSSLKLHGKLKEKNEKVEIDPVILYSGPVKDLCPLAPNNVNTMAVGAMAAHNLGFTGVHGCLIADPSLDCHVVEIEVIGPGIDQTKFHLKTVRTNPAKTGAVTGKATYNSFLSSMLVLTSVQHPRNKDETRNVLIFMAVAEIMLMNMALG
ncbi:putative L-aspartate dehydrogenase isoform X2 [Xenia sp. Carnegie-2017]|uniref:putative L-aspartate dehydrogenase isoform X2 n=1 Tax=Xenia sp. Carnegie-2017 TaxID=2897299 RepID=UPI001F033C45|nr:putative L-aspartate dehydrogenase isoform X2 [Xenia sp. Carnegie-2017]